MSSSAPSLPRAPAPPQSGVLAATRRLPLPAVAGGVIAAPSLLILLGWAISHDTLARGVLRGSISRPVGVLCFALVGLALIAYALPASGRARATATLTLGGVTVVAAVSLVGAAPMPFNTALALLFLAPALAFAAPGRPAEQLPPAQIALVASLVLGFVALTGYLVGAVALDDAATSRTALSGAVALILAAVGALALRPREGILTVLTAPTPSGALLRNLLPPLVLAPLVLGTLRYEGQRHGLFSGSVGIWIMVLGMIAMALAVVARAAAVLDRSDVQRRRAEVRLGEMVHTALNAFIAIDPAGRVVEWNSRAEEMFGWSHAEVVGESLGELIVPEALRAQHHHGVAHYAATGEGPVLGQRLELPARRRDGTEFPVEICISALTGGGAFAFLYDITPRVAARAALESKSVELERSNAELEEFAYVASHDLAEPLRVVSGFAQLLQRRYAGQLDERADTYIEQTVNGAERMRRLIEDLLSYSRVGRGDLEPGPVALAELVEDARAAQGAKIAETGARVEVVGELPVVAGERALLSQLFANLIGNGVKYAGDATPHVEVGAEAQDGCWRVMVRDHGIGIAPEYRERVFKMFQRLHSRDEYEGTGIGLAICRRVVERHGGEITIADTPGGGCTFFFTLPRQV